MVFVAIIKVLKICNILLDFFLIINFLFLFCTQYLIIVLYSFSLKESPKLNRLQAPYIYLDPLPMWFYFIRWVMSNCEYSLWENGKTFLSRVGGICFLCLSLAGIWRLWLSPVAVGTWVGRSSGQLSLLPPWGPPQCRSTDWAFGPSLI